jgi:hypothetical protein
MRLNEISHLRELKDFKKLIFKSFYLEQQNRSRQKPVLKNLNEPKRQESPIRRNCHNKIIEKSEQLAC